MVTRLNTCFGSCFTSSKSSPTDDSESEHYPRRMNSNRYSMESIDYRDEDVEMQDAWMQWNHPTIPPSNLKVLSSSANSGQFPDQPQNQDSTTQKAKILYSPLNEDKDEIRLVTIFPSSHHSELVRCELETVSLKSLIPKYLEFAKLDVGYTNRQTTARWFEVTGGVNRYTWGDFGALSYVWGDPAHTHEIIVNDQTVHVGRNLERALRALSNKDEFREGFRIWIDAICINQEDLVERGKQIGRMKGIYGDAKAVIAWLGDEIDESGKGIHLIRTLAEAYKDNLGEVLASRLMQDPDFLGFGCWLALHDVVNRPYWYRLWILQELVLGASRLVLRCGEEEISWTDFCNGIGVLFDYLWTVKDELMAREIFKMQLQGKRPLVWTTASLHLVHQDLWGLSLRKDPSTEFLTFGYLLDVAHFASAQDPRDKVYGLVGIMDPIIASQIQPNYTASPPKIFAATARLYIETYGNLDPIREGNPWSQLGTPTWAADWTWNGRLRYTRPETVRWGAFWGHKGPTPIMRYAPSYQASGKESPTYSFSEDGLSLTCKGFVLDEVDGLTSRAVGYFEWSEATMIQPKSTHNAYKETSSTAAAIYTTLIADRSTDGTPATGKHKAIFSLPSNFDAALPQFQKQGWSWLSLQKGYYFRWEKWRAANKSFNLLGQQLDSYFSEIIPDDAVENDYVEAYSCFDRTSKSRRLMTTKGGHVGWVPDNMFGDDANQTQHGDLIAIILGCSTPLVVRPAGEKGSFKIVGEAFIQGFMNGKSIELLRNGKFQTQDFTFC